MWDEVEKLVRKGAPLEMLLEHTAMEKKEFRKGFREFFGKTYTEYSRKFILKSKTRMVDWDDIVEELAAGNSIKSICIKHNMTYNFINERCKKTFDGLTIGELKEQYKTVGEDNLRRVIYDKAVEEKDTRAMVWLSRQTLGYSESGNAEDGDGQAPIINFNLVK